MKKTVTLIISFVLVFTMISVPVSAVGNEETTAVEYCIYFMKDMLHSMVGSIYSSFGFDCSLCNSIHREASKADGENNCTLIVNGKDISDSTYVRINYEAENAELPVLAVFKELGADVKSVGKMVVIKYNNDYRWFDTTQRDFGLPILPGTIGGTRLLTVDDLIIDTDSFRYYLAKGFGGIEVNVDYENGIITIDNI
ncbi:MAG: hypothetical protein IJN68_03335 [Clostridia bacterium]|nr:hypothetical protein [Clostridia bacterium]